MDSLKKLVNKQFETLLVAVLDDFQKKMITDDTVLADDVKLTLTGKVDEYKNMLKEHIKNDNKKGKVSKTKGSRAPTAYNLFMKEKMLELKVSSPELTNNQKFAQVASMWAQHKAANPTVADSSAVKTNADVTTPVV